MPKRSRGVRNIGAVAQSHNNFFTAHFKKPDQVRALLTLFMTTAQLELFDLDTLTVATNTQTGAHNLRGSYSDLTLRMQLKAGENIIICLILEHKSHPDSKAVSQLLRYIAAAYEDDEVDAVLPIIIYNGESSWPQHKSFYATRHAHLPKGFLAFSGPLLLNFTVIFVRLGDPVIRRRIKSLAPKERLVLQVMMDIWRAGLTQFNSWVALMRRLPVEWHRDLLTSIHLYFTSVQGESKMEALYDSFKEQQRGDGYMQKILTELEQILPMTGHELQAHGRQIGYEEGIEEGMEKGMEQGIERGMEKGARMKTYEHAKRLFAKGWSTEEVAEFTQLSTDEVKKMRNGI